MRFAIVVLLLAPALLAGCFHEKPAPAVVVRPIPYFMLKDAVLAEGQVGEENVYPKVTIDFDTNVTSDFYVLNAAAETVGELSGVAAYSGRATVELSSWPTLPDHARDLGLALRVIESDTGNMTFEGPLPLVGMNVTYDKVDLHQARGTVAGADVEVTNHGDVPAFLRTAEIDVSGATLTLVPKYGDDGEEPPLAKVIQPGERKKFKLRSDADTGLDASSYAPPGAFNITLRMQFHNGPAASRAFTFTHEVRVKSVDQVDWSTDGVKRVALTLETRGDFPVALSAATWGFTPEKATSTMEELGKDAVLILDPNRQYKLTLEKDGAQVRSSNANDTGLRIELRDPSGQALLTYTHNVSKPSLNLTSLTSKWSCEAPATGNVKDCELSTLSFYGDPQTATPVYVSGFRITFGDLKHIDRRTAAVGAAQGAREQAFEIGGFSFGTVKQGTSKALRVEALYLDGSVAGVYAGTIVAS